MKEDFLHYLWRYKKFDVLNLKTTIGETVQIISSGSYLELAGPDFFNAQLVLGNQKWAGNVEIHIKSSDWYVHNHEKDNAYQNVILHVVWEHDTIIFREDNSEIPTIELRDFVSAEVLVNYKKLVQPKSWIYCEKEIATIDNFIFSNWKERLFFERLERKSKLIFELLSSTNNDWEAVLFCLLAKNFGLNTNGESFLAIAKALPFSIIRKESFEVENLEALLFGKGQLLVDEKEDVYFNDLKFRYFYMLHKYRLEEGYVQPLQFFKLRPDNFPTIRLSQLAHLYHHHQNLFTKVIDLKSNVDGYELLQVSVSDYWQTHYTFDKVSSKKSKKLSKAFIDLLLINTVIPIQFAYAQSRSESNSEQLLQFMNQIVAEKNSTIDKFTFFKVAVNTAFDSQSLLHLKKEYCAKNKCLSCAVGMELLKVKSEMKVL